MTNLRRSWSRVGERAVPPHRMAYTNRDPFSAASPRSGESFHRLGSDGMDSEAGHAFLRALERGHPEEHVAVVLDDAPGHRRQDLKEIAGLSVIFLAPSSPELNPAERFFEAIRRATANVVFAERADIEAAIAEAVNRRADDAEAMRRLLGYGWMREQCRGVS